jgi:lipopolysaccharide biosynthesis regulator YciM
LSIFTHTLTLVDIPSVILAIGRARWQFAHPGLLDRAGPTALLEGDEEKRREAALKVIGQLTSDDGSWIRAILRWRKPDDGSGP